MQLGPLFLVAAAATAVSAACTGRPCGPDAIIRIVKKPELSDAASSFCSTFNQATTTETDTLTTTTTVEYLETVPAFTVTVTEPFTVTTVLTAYSTSYYTVAPAVSTLKKKRSIDFGSLTDLSQFPASRISSACSCLVPTPAPALTLTETETDTVTVSFPITLPGEDEAVITVTQTTTLSQTTTVVTAVPTIVAPGLETCGADRQRDFCCLSTAPWSTNSGVWGNICGYTPNVLSELIGARCSTLRAVGFGSLGQEEQIY
ncbi:hypothetical protein N0V88_000384 [Collariella sp. IMI 366227]|nr:hypothetical protein N0V88_000384 [Collariella sp. IMI 366227]